MEILLYTKGPTYPSKTTKTKPINRVKKLGWKHLKPNTQPKKKRRKK